MKRKKAPRAFFEVVKTAVPDAMLQVAGKIVIASSSSSSRTLPLTLTQHHQQQKNKLRSVDHRELVCEYKEHQVLLHMRRKPCAGCHHEVAPKIYISQQCMAAFPPSKLVCCVACR